MSSNKSVSTNTTVSFSTAATSDANNSVRFPKKIFLVVSPLTTESQLYSLAAQYGKVNDVYIPKNDHKKSRCFAFIAFRWHEDAVAAMRGLEGSVLDGTVLHPRWAAARKSKKDVETPKAKFISVSSAISPSTVTAGTATSGRFPKKIFLDVSPSTSEARLYFLVAQYGEVNDVHIAVNEQRKSRGFAFIIFRWHEDAIVAMEELEGHVLDGLVLHPRWAAPKKGKPQDEKTKSKRNGSRKERQKKKKKNANGAEAKEEDGGTKAESRQK